MKNTVINGISFTEKKINFIQNDEIDIYRLYGRPSTTKVMIYNKWKEILHSIEGMTGNCNNFSIFGTIKDELGKIHKVKITKSYNYLIHEAC